MFRSRRPFTASAVFLIGLLIASLSGAAADSFHGRWVVGRIEETFHRLGGESFFGKALTDELVSARDGRYQEFERDTAIYWHRDVAGDVAHQIGGLIRVRWSDYQRESGPLGYPITDELVAPDQQGRFNHFEHGSIFWHPNAGAHSLSGSILAHWTAMGGVAGRYGYPTSEPFRIGDTVHQNFQRGKIEVKEASTERLPVSDNRLYTSYRIKYPLIELDTETRWTSEGTAEAVRRKFGTFFPYSGCPSDLDVGSLCRIETTPGVPESFRVIKIADDGVSFETLSDSPEGAGRTITFRYSVIRAMDKEQNEMFLGGKIDIPFRLTYETSTKPWIVMTVESFGPIKNAQWAGPLNSQRIAEKVWNVMARSIRSGVESTDTTYLVSDRLEEITLPNAVRPFGLMGLPKTRSTAESIDDAPFDFGEKETVMRLEEFTPEERNLWALSGGQ
ncbi:LGFP repeat-containing protein [Corynebacterium ulcerans]|uniref:LGFP repeat-containing protein n=1 Tax=Corynebacterium ulcerans TaxID=65058 RepID=UPI0018D9E959|nr:hypothetical protein [Corynebacterium ulcerans]MBH5301674.1 hypothetical protein [Corynebacterium ulcerans]